MVVSRKRATGKTNTGQLTSTLLSNDAWTLDAIIEVLQTHTTIQPGMVDTVEQQLYRAISTNSSTTTSSKMSTSQKKTAHVKTSLGKQGPLLASYAMRFANTCLTWLSNYIVQLSDKKNVPAVQSSYVATISMYTAQTLLALDKYKLVSLTGYELIQAISGLISKCIDANEYTSSLKVLDQLHDCLNTLITTESVVTSTSSDTTIKHNISVSNLLSSTCNIQVATLVIQCQLNIIRCWIGLGYFHLIEKVIRSIVVTFTDKSSMDNGHCLDWLNIAIRLKQSKTRNNSNSNSNNNKKQQQSIESVDQLASHLFREFYRMASKLSTMNDSCTPACILQLRLLALRCYLLSGTSFDFNTFCDYASRFSALFERTSRPSSFESSMTDTTNNSVMIFLVQYHDQLLDWIERELTVDKLKVTANYTTWCEYHLYAARKSMQWDGALRNVHILIKLSMAVQNVHDQSTSTNDDQLDTRCSSLYTIWFLLEAAKVKWYQGKDINSMLKYIAKATSLNWPTFDKHDVITTQLSTTINKLTQSIEGLCHLLGEFTDDMLIDNRNLVKVTATLIEQCFHLLINSSKNNELDKMAVSLITIAVHCLFRRLAKYHALSFHLLDLVKQSLDNNTISITDADIVKISTAYYNVGGRLYKAKETVWAEKAMSTSCQLLERTSLTDVALRKQLGKQLELLTACQCVHGHFKEAQQSLWKAIRYWPENEITLEHERISDWISRWVDIGLSSIKTSYIYLYQQFITPAIFSNATLRMIKAMEWRSLCQYHKRDTLTLQILIVDELLEEYSVNMDHPIQRGSWLVEKAKILHLQVKQSSVELTENKSLEMAIDLLSQAIDLYGTKHLKQDAELINVLPQRIAYAYTWFAIIGHRCGFDIDDAVDGALDHWEHLLKQSEKNGNTKTIEDIESLYDHLLYFSSFIRTTHKPDRMLRLHFICLQVNERRKQTDNKLNIQDNIKLLLQIATTFFALGYADRVDVLLKQIEPLYNNIDLEQNEWLLACARYKIAQGHMDDSKILLEQAQTWQPEEFEERVRFQTRLKYRLLQADTFMVHAEWQCLKGNLNTSLSYAMSNIRFLARITASLTARQSSDTTTQDPFQLEITSTTRTRMVSAEDVNALSNYSSHEMIQRWINGLLLVARLYMLRGSFKEADYYLDQAQQLAEMAGTQVLLHDVLGELARLAYLRHKEDQYTARLPTLEHYHLKQQANWQLYQGERALHQSQWEVAKQHYKNVNRLLAPHARQSFIESLEKRAKWKWWSSVRFTKEQDGELLQPTMERALFLCGWTSSQDGDYQASRLCFSSATLPYLMPEYTLWHAKSILHELMMTVSDNSMFGRLHDSILGMGLGQMMSVKTSSSRRANARRDSQVHFSHTLMKLEESLKQAYDTGYYTLSPALLREICHTLAQIQIMSSYSTMSVDGDTSKQQQYIWSALFYLEMAKNITLRREIGAQLKEQLENTMLKTSHNSETTQSSQHRRLVWPTLDEPSWQQSTDDVHRKCLDRYRLYEHESKLQVNDWLNSFVNQLPDHVVICSVSVHEEAKALYVGRYGSPRSGIEPSVIRLPLTRKSSRDINGEIKTLSYDEANRMFTDILEESNASMRVCRPQNEGGNRNETADSSASVELSRKEKAMWWDTRHALDKRLASLLDQLECDWWCGFKGLLRAPHLLVGNATWNEHRMEFSRRLSDLLDRTVSTMGRRRVSRLEIHPTFCDILIYAGTGLRQATTPEEVDEADQQLTNDVEDIMYYLLDTLMYQGVPVPFDEIEFDKLLVEMKCMISEWQQLYQSTLATTAVSKVLPNTVLILDKSTHMFPWESMPILEGQSVSRLPTWTIWRDNIMIRDNTGASNEILVNANRTQYLLNPAGDLLHTEKLLAPLMKQNKWKGITGRVPMEQELWTSLTNSDIFLYFGHGGAGQYIKGSAIRKLDCCAVTLLMGCSSGYLAPEGEFEPTGTPLHYLIGGSQAVVANLWDVTDKDTDRFSIALLKRWGLLSDTTGVNSSKNRSRSHASKLAASSGHDNLGAAVAVSRSECTLRYLVGAAPVIYGMPHIMIVPS